MGPPVVIADSEPVANELPVVEPEPAPLGAAEEGIFSPTPGPFTDQGSCRANDTAPPAGGKCDDNAGAPGSCAAVRLPGGCSSFAFICDKCESYKQHFKPAVAARAVGCVTAQKQQQLGDGCETYRCGDEALRSACPDASAQNACQTIASQCRVPLYECTQMLSGMNGAGRAEVAACAAQGCQFGLWSCIEGM